MSNYIERLIIEQRELQDKVDKLDAFINGAKFPDIDTKEQSLLVEQYNAMCKYCTILKSRLKLHGVKTKH